MKATLTIHVHRNFTQTTLRLWDTNNTYTERSVCGRDIVLPTFLKLKAADMWEQLANVTTVQDESFPTFPYPAFLDIQLTMPTGDLMEEVVVTSARFGTPKGAIDFASSFSGSLITNDVRMAVLNKMMLRITNNEGDELIKTINALTAVSGKKLEK